MLDNVPGCNLVQYQGKLIIQPWKNGQNPNSTPNLRLPKFFSYRFYLCLKLDKVPKYHHMQFIEKLMHQTWENCKKTNFRSDFGLLPLLVVRHHSKLSSYAIQRKTIGPNLRKKQKKLIWAWFWPVYTKNWSQKLFSWVLPLLDAKHFCKLSLCSISREIN